MEPYSRAPFGELSICIRQMSDHVERGFWKALVHLAKGPQNRRTGLDFELGADKEEPAGRGHSGRAGPWRPHGGIPYCRLVVNGSTEQQSEGLTARPAHA